MAGYRQAAVARDCVVSLNGERVVVTIENGHAAIVLERMADAALAGSGAIQVEGRVLAGVDTNDRPLLRSAAGACSLGILTPH